MNTGNRGHGGGNGCNTKWSGVEWSGVEWSIRQGCNTAGNTRIRLGVLEFGTVIRQGILEFGCNTRTAVIRQGITRFTKLCNTALDFTLALIRHDFRTSSSHFEICPFKVWEPVASLNWRPSQDRFRVRLT